MNNKITELLEDTIDKFVDAQMSEFLLTTTVINCHIGSQIMLIANKENNTFSTLEYKDYWGSDYFMVEDTLQSLDTSLIKVKKLADTLREDLLNIIVANIDVFSIEFNKDSLNNLDAFEVMSKIEDILLSDKVTEELFTMDILSDDTNTRIDKLIKYIKQNLE